MRKKKAIVGRNGAGHIRKGEGTKDRGNISYNQK
jgi:hypothetical protein